MQKVTGRRIVVVVCLIWLLTLPLGVNAASFENGADLELHKTVFLPGEQIRVRFTAAHYWPSDAWIGIIPSSIQHGSETLNDEYDITYQYLEKRTSGVMVFTAPGPGQWDLRMHNTDSNGREVAYVSFSVTDNVVPSSNDAKLILEKTVFSPGERIRVRFTTPGGWPRDAWIGIIPSSIRHGSESLNDEYDITYQYLENRVVGVMVFTAPDPGQWDLRMHDTDNNGREITSVPFIVQ